MPREACHDRDNRNPRSVAGLHILLAIAATTLASAFFPGTPKAVTQSAAASAKPALQPLIDATKDGETLSPPAGVYAGPVVIMRPIVLDGSNGVTVDGGGKGTVVHVHTNGATVRNIKVVNSGDQHNDIDAGIRIEGNFNVVKDNAISESLFGIDLQEAHNNLVRRNTIVSKSDVDLGVKGDAVRLWYSRDNKLEENRITGSRDFVVWYSTGNTISHNNITQGRYGLHFMYARDNIVEDNHLERNSVGISLMYDEGDIVRRNRIVQALGAAGVGIGLKEASNVVIVGNEVLYNAVGMAFDITPFQPDSSVLIADNTIAFNDIGVSFLSDRIGNIFEDNRFLSNTQHVAMRLFESAAKASWKGNHWDDYEGFDRNHDGIGDKPYVMRSFADRLWMDVPSATFFKGSPALTALDFIERLAPFTEPLMLLTDSQPRMSRTFAARKDRTLPSKLPSSDADEGPDGGPAASAASSPPQKAGHDMTPDGRIDPFGLYKK